MTEPYGITGEIKMGGPLLNLGQRENQRTPMKLPTYSTTAKTLRFFILCLAASTSSFQVASAQRPSVADRPSVLFLNIDDWNDWNSVLKGEPKKGEARHVASHKSNTHLAVRNASRGRQLVLAFINSPVYN